MQGLLLRSQGADSRQLSFEFMREDALTRQLQLEWEQASEKEKQSRTLFAQRSIKVDEVSREWEAMRLAIGTGVDVRRFLSEVVGVHGGFAAEKNGSVEFKLPNLAPLREACGGREEFTARFELPVKDKVLHLTRTHPIVEGVAGYVMDAALDPLGEGKARRCGVIRTRAVERSTTLLVLRIRYHIEQSLSLIHI